LQTISMKNMRTLLLLLFTGLTTASYCQFAVTGIIRDSETKEPLQGASVFAQNTTLGTITNKDGLFALNLKSGGYDLIITYTGYQTRILQVNSEETKESLDIELIKEDRSLAEVVIQSSNEVKDGWEKYGSFFIAKFIGSTPFAAQCFLENPDSLRFFYYKRSNKLKVLSTVPLVIHNKALGYNMNYVLDSFVYYYNDELSSYRGYCLFSEMDGTVQEKRAWSANRRKAYQGSKLHFMRSYYDSTLVQEGFRIQLLAENSERNFVEVRNPYDTSHYFVPDSADEIEVYYPRAISITYLKKAPENEYLQQYKLPMDIGVQTTYAQLKNAIAIKQNGYFYEQRDWINQGYWSWKNLADLLPYDY
jgi:hypothetical protein